MERLTRCWQSMIKMKKQTYNTSNLHCVQCHRRLVYKVDLGDSVVSICHRPDCPNYGLLALPQELMPTEEDLKK